MAKLRITTKDREIFANRLSNRQYNDFFEATEQIAKEEKLVLAVFGEPNTWSTFVVSSEQGLQLDDSVEWTMLFSVFSVMEYPDPDEETEEEWAIPNSSRESEIPMEACRIRILRASARYHPHYIYAHRSAALPREIFEEAGGSDPLEVAGGLLSASNPSRLDLPRQGLYKKELTKFSMRFIYCRNPLKTSGVDPLYTEESGAAEDLGVQISLLDFGTLVESNDAIQATRRIRATSEEPELGIYRGWMLRPAAYTSLYETLERKGINLINPPKAYQHCHYLPENYSIIKENTPETVWIKLEAPGSGFNLPEIMKLLAPFGNQPLILKDYVKSRKHEWNEACYIPSASDQSAVERVVSRFLKLQGDELNEGLVFRIFKELEPLATHSKSGMPLTKEFRLFFLDGAPLFTFPYWDEGEYGDLEPPVKDFQEVAGRVESRFFTMDIVRTTKGEWIIIELGDGQVAGLPENANIPAFYKSIVEQLTKGA